MADPTVSSLVNSLSLLNGVLMTGLALAGTVVLLRFLRKDVFTAFNVTFDLRYAWTVFLLFTVAHWYLSNIVRDDTHAVVQQSAAVQEDAWNQIAGGSFLLLHGMRGRTAVVDYKIGSIHLHKLLIETDDRTKVLDYGCAILLFFAGFNWPLSDAFRRPLTALRQALPTLLLSGYIVFINWSLATGWMYALSQLTPPD